MQVATDESYRDPTNLSGKLKKHQAFEAELSANRNTLDAVCGVSHLVMWEGGEGGGIKWCSSWSYRSLFIDSLVEHLCSQP